MSKQVVNSLILQIRRTALGCLVFVWPMIAMAAPYEGPLIDAHVHLSAGSDVKKIRNIFQTENVVSAVFFPRQFRAGDDLGVSDRQESDLSENYRALGVVLIGLQREYLKGKGNDRAPKWLEPDAEWDGFLALANGELTQKRRRGLGELIVRHYDYHGKGHGNNDFPLRSKVVYDLMGLANKHQVPLVIHAEGEPHIISELLELLPRYPDGKFVWAHACGRSNAEWVRKWLVANPNLYCDLANMTDTGNYGSLWPRASPWTIQIERGGVLLPEWKALLEDMPDRFMVGSDVNEVKGWNQAWTKRIRRFRELLGQVNPNAARLIGEGNAREVFGIRQ